MRFEAGFVSKWDTKTGLDSKINPLLISRLGPQNQGASWDSN